MPINPLAAEGNFLKKLDTHRREKGDDLRSPINRELEIMAAEVAEREVRFQSVHSLKTIKELQLLADEEDENEIPLSPEDKRIKDATAAILHKMIPYWFGRNTKIEQLDQIDTSFTGSQLILSGKIGQGERKNPALIGLTIVSAEEAPDVIAELAEDCRSGDSGITYLYATEDEEPSAEPRSIPRIAIGFDKDVLLALGQFAFDDDPDSKTMTMQKLTRKVFLFEALKQINVYIDIATRNKKIDVMRQYIRAKLFIEELLRKEDARATTTDAVISRISSSVDREQQKHAKKQK